MSSRSEFRVGMYVAISTHKNDVRFAFTPSCL